MYYLHLNFQQNFICFIFDFKYLNFYYLHLILHHLLTLPQNCFLIHLHYLAENYFFIDLHCLIHCGLIRPLHLIHLRYLIQSYPILPLHFVQHSLIIHLLGNFLSNQNHYPLYLFHQLYLYLLLLLLISLYHFHLYRPKLINIFQCQ